MSLIVQLGTVVTATGPLDNVDNPQVVEVHTSMGTSEEPVVTEASVAPEEKETPSSTTGLLHSCSLPYQFVLQDHNYGAPPPPSPPSSPQPARQSTPPPKTSPCNSKSASVTTAAIAVLTGSVDEDSHLSMASSNAGEGEETETAPEGEEDDSITRCICDFQHDDGYMICCDKCSVWQHVDCMGLDRSNIPDEYMCELCQPRKVDKQGARTLQLRRGKDIFTDSSSSESENAAKRKGSWIKKEEKKGKRRRSLTKDQKGGNRKTVKRKEKKADNKKNTVARKKGRRKSIMQEGEEETRHAWDHGVQLRQWIDRYEEAVTNHYSPELRARIQGIRVNGVHSDFKANLNSPQKCKVSHSGSGAKLLLASSNIQQNHSIIEYRGKYMLTSQYHQQSPLTAKQYQAFILFYQIPKDGAEVCVDARKYGNDARFVRRSCKPNAGIRHCIEKGSLHLYVVASSNIERNEEITIPHDHRSCVGHVPCACGTTDCPVASIFRKNGITESEKERRQKRGKRVASSDDVDTNLAAGPASKKGVKSPVKLPVTEEQHETTRTEGEQDQGEKKKLTREERKMEAIMKAIDRLEKAEQRRQETLARLAQKKVQEVPKKEEEKPVPDEKKKEEEEQKKEEEEEEKKYEKSAEEEKNSDGDKGIEKSDAEGDKGTDKSGSGGDKGTDKSGGGEDKGTDKSSGGDKTEKNSGGDVASSADEGAKSTSERVKRRGKKGRWKMSTPPRRRSRMYSGESDALSADETPVTSASPLTPPNSFLSVNYDSSNQCNAPLTPLSASICAVSSFKFPKTKKSIMNEWLNETSDTVIHPLSFKTEGLNELSMLIPTCYVRGAKSPTGISAVHLRRASTGGTPVKMQRSVGGSAKKRWLRQAISEESDSPLLNGGCASPVHIRLDSGSPSPPQDYVTPLKKRRLARESMSSEQSFTPPSTPSACTATIGEEVDFRLNGLNGIRPKLLEDVLEGEIQDAKYREVEGKTEFQITTEKTEDNIKGEKEDESYENELTELDTECNIKEEEEVDFVEEEENNIPSDTETESKKEICLEKTERIEEEQHTENIVPDIQEEKSVESEVQKVPGEETRIETLKCSSEENMEVKDTSSSTLEILVDSCNEEATLNEEVKSESDTVQTETCSDSLQPAAVPENMEKTENDLSDEASLQEAGDTAVDNVGAELSPVKNDENKIRSCNNILSLSNKLLSPEKGPSESSANECFDETVPETEPSQTQQVATQPTRRKLSILEYRKRKTEAKKSLDGKTEVEDTESSQKTGDSKANSVKPLEEELKNLKSPPILIALPLFEKLEELERIEKNKKAELEKKVKERKDFCDLEDVRWNSAPTLVEQQRENLTERLRREFGLFLGEEEEEKESKGKKSGLQAGGNLSPNSADLPPPPPPSNPPPSHIPTVIGVHSSHLPSTMAQTPHKGAAKSMTSNLGKLGPTGIISPTVPSHPSSTSVLIMPLVSVISNGTTTSVSQPHHYQSKQSSVYPFSSQFPQYGTKFTAGSVPASPYSTSQYNNKPSPATASRYPLTPIASNTSTQYPVTPIVSSTSSQYPVTHIASNATSQYPPPPVSSSTVNQYPSASSSNSASQYPLPLVTPIPASQYTPTPPPVAAKSVGHYPPPPPPSATSPAKPYVLPPASANTVKLYPPPPPVTTVNQYLPVPNSSNTVGHFPPPPAAPATASHYTPTQFHPVPLPLPPPPSNGTSAASGMKYSGTQYLSTNQSYPSTGQKYPSLPGSQHFQPLSQQYPSANHPFSSKQPFHPAGSIPPPSKQPSAASPANGPQYPSQQYPPQVPAPSNPPPSLSSFPPPPVGRSAAPVHPPLPQQQGVGNIRPAVVAGHFTGTHPAPPPLRETKPYCGQGYFSKPQS